MNIGGTIVLTVIMGFCAFAQAKEIPLMDKEKQIASCSSKVGQEEKCHQESKKEDVRKSSRKYDANRESGKDFDERGYESEEIPGVEKK